MTEADGTVSPMFPNEARLRNLTYARGPVSHSNSGRADSDRMSCRYSAPLYIDMKKRVLIQESEHADPETGEMAWREEKDEGEDSGEDSKVYIGKVSFVLVSELEPRALNRLFNRFPSCSEVISAFWTVSPSRMCWI